MKRTIEISSLSNGRKHYHYEGDCVPLKDLFNEIYNDIAWRLSELNLHPQVVVPTVHAVVGDSHKCYLYDEISEYMKTPPADAMKAVANSLRLDSLPGYYSDTESTDECQILYFGLYHGETGETLAIVYENSDGTLETDYLHASSDELVGMQDIIKALLYREQDVSEE